MVFIETKNDVTFNTDAITAYGFESVIEPSLKFKSGTCGFIKCGGEKYKIYSKEEAIEIFAALDKILKPKKPSEILQN